MHRTAEMTHYRLVIGMVINVALMLAFLGCGGSSAPRITKSAPSITTQPQSQTIASGLTATLAVVATGTAPLSYQWYQGSSGTTTNSISGASGATYTTPALTATTNYWVQVSNSAGSVASNTATITIAKANANGIPDTFFGFTINHACSITDTDPSGVSCGNPSPHSFPGLPFKFSRSLDTGKLRWRDIELCDPTASSCAAVSGCTPNAKAASDPTNCAYDWSRFDWWTQIYNSKQVDWMYVAYYTPDFASVRGSRCTGAGTSNSGPDPTCAGAADLCGQASGAADLGGCDPPSDIDSVPGNGDGKGTNAAYKNFVTAFVSHLQQAGESIQYWEVWNEPNVCPEWNHADQTGMDCSGLAPNTGTVAQLVRMAQDARSILPSTVKVSTPPVTDVAGINNYLQPILAAAGASLFDVVGFHGYFNLPNSACGAGGCPVPEGFVKEWAALTGVMSNTGTSSKPAINTEFSWGAKSNVTDPDMRAAFAARSYLLQLSEYPALARVDWYGEDFAVDTSTSSLGVPAGGTGELWAATSGSPDNCTVPDPIQGGYDCPAGLAVQQVAKWTIGAGFAGACSCSNANGVGNCSATPPTGVFACTVTQANGKPGLLVWDNTAVTFPCPGGSNGACGSTTFTVPSGLNADWQDLNGNTTPLTGSTVTIGAKPILIE